MYNFAINIPLLLTILYRFIFIFRACFKKLPRILCFNTMRYTFNMLTMLKEKVNTHFSFPMRLDMSGYVEKHLMPAQYQGMNNHFIKVYIINITKQAQLDQLQWFYVYRIDIEYFKLNDDVFVEEKKKFAESKKDGEGSQNETEDSDTEEFYE